MSNSFKKNSNDLSKQLIGSIFAQQNISNFKYEMIQYESDLSKLIRQKFFTSINFCGANSLLVFTKIAGKHYCFTIERQTLSYNFSKIDYDKVKLDMKNIRLDIDIYNGTILDGILVKQTKKDDLFIISDVYTFCGVNYTKNKLDEKLKMIIKYLQSNYDENHIENNILLSVNKIYPIAKTQYVVDEILPSIKNLKYRGLCFYPEISDTKLIFLFNNDNREKDRDNRENNEEMEVKLITNKPHYEKKVEFTIHSGNTVNLANKVNLANIVHSGNIVNLKDERDEKDKTAFKYVNTSNKDVYATLEVKSTSNPDVYKLNAVERVIVDGKKILKRVPMGIAYISGIDKSHKNSKIFSQEKKVLMKCKFINDKSKWEPIEVDKDSSHPTLLENIDLELMELSEDDN
jgi:hypothetical protein